MTPASTAAKDAARAAAGPLLTSAKQYAQSDPELAVAAGIASYVYENGPPSAADIEAMATQAAAGVAFGLGAVACAGAPPLAVACGALASALTSAIGSLLGGSGGTCNVSGCAGDNPWGFCNCLIPEMMDPLDRACFATFGPNAVTRDDTVCLACRDWANHWYATGDASTPGSPTGISTTEAAFARFLADVNWNAGGQGQYGPPTPEFINWCFKNGKDLPKTHAQLLASKDDTAWLRQLTLAQEFWRVYRVPFIVASLQVVLASRNAAAIANVTNARIGAYISAGGCTSAKCQKYVANAIWNRTVEAAIVSRFSLPSLLWGDLNIQLQTMFGVQIDDNFDPDQHLLSSPAGAAVLAQALSGEAPPLSSHTPSVLLDVLAGTAIVGSVYALVQLARRRPIVPPKVRQALHFGGGR